MRPLVLILFCLCVAAGSSRALFVIDPATFSETDCSSPALASSDDGMSMLAYVSSEEPLLMNFVLVQSMPTTRTDTSFQPEPVLLNAGSSPEICWTWTGFHLAFVSGDMIMIYHQDSTGNWDQENFTMLPTNGPVRNLEILGASSNTGNPYVYLAVHTFLNDPQEINRVQFASCDNNGWTQLASLDIDPQMSNPQLDFQMGSSAPQLFYHGGETPDNLHLKSSTLAFDTGWSSPVFIDDQTGTPSPIANEFDVSTRSGDINILGLGAQPSCPCGTIHLQSYISVIGWWVESNVTAHYADYDWPKSPKIAAHEFCAESHAFWYQESAASDMTPWRKTLEYRTIENGEMFDAGDFLDEPGRGGPLGSRVALAVNVSNNPVLAWTRRDTIDGEPQPERIWIAREACLAAVPESEISHPLVLLSAWPNPFNPQVSLSFELDQAQTVHLDIFDARGRRVTTLIDRIVNGGPSKITWNARNDSGRRVPSGVYFARLNTGGKRTVLKMVLAQ